MEKVLDYLAELNTYNDREWFHEHKNEYKEALHIFEELVSSLILSVGLLEQTIIYQNPKNLIYRVARDLRFTKDKTPYNPAFRAHISPYGKSFIPLGYYIHIQPGGETFVGCGLHGGLKPKVLGALRDHIADTGAELKGLIHDSAFTRYFNLEGECLKNIPRGYDPEHPYAEYLKYKSLFVQGFIPDQTVRDFDSLTEAVMERYRIIKPFKDYLNRGITAV